MDDHYGVRDKLPTKDIDDIVSAMIARKIPIDVAVGIAELHGAVLEQELVAGMTITLWVSQDDKGHRGWYSRERAAIAYCLRRKLNLWAE